jgi:glycosyltransferase involved in cell wall biosynthesis
MPLRIAFPYPAYWPYVRRGAERLIHDLSGYLAGRGHQVDIITSKPGRPRTVLDRGVRVIYLTQLSHPIVFRHMPLMKLHAFGLEATRLLVRNRYDAAHLMSFSGVSAAPFLRRWLALPYLFHLIVREHIWTGRFERFIFQQLIRNADRVATLTPGWATQVSAQYNVRAEALPPPVDMSVFRPRGERDLHHPQVLFPGDLGDPRKGGALLLRAWDEIHRRCPEATLALAGPFGLAGFNEKELAHSVMGQLAVVRSPAARAAIELRGPGAVGQLPQWYAQAAVTVLPSFDEAFGMVVTESLASGTPVVCSSDAGPGEIVTSPDIGATVPIREYLDLYSPKLAHQLADAVLSAIDLARRPGAAERCRAWVEPWSLERVGARAERLYEELAGRGARSAARPIPEAVHD